LPRLPTENDRNLVFESRQKIILHAPSSSFELLHFILAKRSVEALEVKVRPENPFEPILQDPRQEVELL
jgi:hypothetical protein